MRKPAFCKNRDADQLRGNHAMSNAFVFACFCYVDRTVPLHPKSKISNLYSSSVAVQPGLCRT